MAEQHASRPVPKSVFVLEPGEELDEVLAAGFPIYQNGVEIDRFYPLQQAPIDWDALPADVKRVFDAFGSVRGLNWEETEADLERIDRESTPTPPIEFDW
jgi:hypothetical protein